MLTKDIKLKVDQVINFLGCQSRCQLYLKYFSLNFMSKKKNFELILHPQYFLMKITYMFFVFDLINGFLLY